MTTKELESLYKTACYGKGFEPNKGQFKVWEQTLGWCEEKHLAQAIIWWFSDNVSFPMPAELKPLAERSRREQMARAQEKTELVGWTCPECGIHVSGFIPPTDHEPRVCNGVPKGSPQLDEWGRPLPCGAILEETYRGPAEKVVTQYARA